MNDHALFLFKIKSFKNLNNRFLTLNYLIEKENHFMITKYDEIVKIKLDLINPIRYSKDRNFIDGSVSKLSPYISRGVISTKMFIDF